MFPIIGTLFALTTSLLTCCENKEGPKTKKEDDSNYEASNYVDCHNVTCGINVKVDERCCGGAFSSNNRRFYFASQ